MPNDRTLEWLPIASAPKDGTWFMTINADFSGPEPEIEIGAFDPCYWDRYVEVGNGLYRKEHDQIYDWRGFNNFHRATHWMPLPAPPAALDPKDAGASGETGR